MDFKSGDYVVHPAYGVGHIVRLEQRQLAEAEMCWYYVLAINKSTVWVPMNSDGSTRLRTVTSKQELDRCRRLLKGRPTPLERDHRTRRLKISEQLTENSFQLLCEVVRDLTAAGWHARIGEADAAFLLKARDHLRREWAAAAGMSVSEADQEVDALLLIGREAYKS